MSISIPSDELTQFAKLPEECRVEVRQRLRVMQNLLGIQRGIQAAIAANASTLGLSPKRLRALYDEFRASRDWQVLINRARFPQNDDNRLSAELVTLWKTLCERNQRKCKPAYRELIRMWQRGEPAGVQWPKVDPATHVPTGMTYRNMMRYASSLFERRAMRDGLGAAMARHGPKVLTTRVGLWVGSHFIIDDVLRDIKILLLGNQGATNGRVQELGVLDLYSADRFAIHRRPQFVREDGTKDSIKEKEMRFLVASILRNVGYSPRGTEFVAELGTAAIRKQLAAFLHEQSGGKLTVRLPGITGREQVIAGYWGSGGGNPRHKTQLESHHNLIHNEAANLPAATGHDRNPPEWLHGLEATTQQIIRWIGEMPPEQASLLRVPMLEYWQALGLLGEIDDRIAWRTDHEIEGWVECRHTAVEYRQNILRDEWITQADFLALPENDQHALAEAAAAYPAFRRVRKLAPREVFSRGAGELIRLPDHVIALMFCDRELGDDLRKPKRLTADGKLELQDVTIAPEAMQFGREIVRPDGGREWLAERTDYGVVLNPFDTAALWVYGPRGEFLGTAAREHRASRVIEGQIQEALGRRSHETAALLAPLRDRHSDVAQLMQEVSDHNAAVRNGAPVTPETRDLAKRQRARASGAGMDDFMTPATANPTTTIPLADASDFL